MVLPALLPALWPVYLVDFSCFNPPQELKADALQNHQAGRRWKCYTKEKLEHMDKILMASGIGCTSPAIPANLQPMMSDAPKTDLTHAAAEAKLVYGQVISDVLHKTGLRPTDVDILLTSTSVYCPVPSVASMVVNMFKMREDVQAYHLGGMGCSMGAVGLNLMRDLLVAHPGKICLFATSEIVTSAFYTGERKEALTGNALFRMGGTASILTNNLAWRRRAKYSLQHCLRVHMGASDDSFSAASWEPDEAGINGMFLSKTLLSSAAAVLDKGVRKMTPHIMTWRQYAEAALNYAQQAIATLTGGTAPPAYQPDYTRCADHFLLHAGGYGVLRGIQKGMRLPADKMMPSFASLRDFGNTSSASTWYTWSYIEATTGVAAGETALQVVVGSGMKSGVAYWRALRPVRDAHACWAHLRGRALTEADLPRPISTKRSAMEQAAASTAGKESAVPAMHEAQPQRLHVALVVSDGQPGKKCM